MREEQGQLEEGPRLGQCRVQQQGEDERAADHHRNVDRDVRGNGEESAAERRVRQRVYVVVQSGEDLFCATEAEAGGVGGEQAHPARVDQWGEGNGGEKDEEGGQEQRGGAALGAG